MRCAVLGHPIAHSLSPVMHRAAYAHLGLSDWTYDAYDVDEDGLGGFVTGLDATWRGLSLTMPLKWVVLPLLDEVSAVAAAVGGANTVVLERGRSVGHNTDVPGIVAALHERGVASAGSACIVGAGATAASAAAALHAIGVRRLVLAVREPSRAEVVADLARSWGVDVRLRHLDEPATGERVDVSVSTVPSVAVAVVAEALVAASDAVLDVVYDPWPPALAIVALRGGVPYVSGLDLLAHQASLQVALMTGREVPADLLRVAAERQLTR